jgi:hypothetical protein
MLDILIGLAFLAMILGPAIAASFWQAKSHQADR